jgi:hypothetical protein
MADLKPVEPSYMLSMITLKPGDRLHRLVSRLADTYFDDLSDDRIIELERLADTFRLTHADGSSLGQSVFGDQGQ